MTEPIIEGEGGLILPRNDRPEGYDYFCVRCGLMVDKVDSVLYGTPYRSTINGALVKLAVCVTCKDLDVVPEEKADE